MVLQTGISVIHYFYLYVYMHIDVCVCVHIYMFALVAKCIILYIGNVWQRDTETLRIMEL